MYTLKVQKISCETNQQGKNISRPGGFAALRKSMRGQVDSRLKKFTLRKWYTQTQNPRSHPHGSDSKSKISPGDGLAAEL